MRHGATPAGSPPRIRRLARVLGLLSALLAFACAGSTPDAYQQSRAAAERAYAHGRYAEAAERWLEAARHAERDRDRNEARYRAAASLARAGDHAAAGRLYEEIAETRGHERAARAAFDRAKLEIAEGDVQLGYRLLREALVAHPDSGLAPGGLRRLLAWRKEQAGLGDVLRTLDSLLPVLGKTELGEYLHYEYATALRASGRTRAARERYLYVASRYPYPEGALWDDALWHASLLDEALGDHRAAVRRLRHMLAERESTGPPGSYQRPRYDDAQFRIGELYRDRLNDPEQAIVEFRKVFTDHPDSVLRDDALWAAALVAHAAGDQSTECELLESLVEELPDSRYAPCAHELCPRISVPGDRPCHAYIRQPGDGSRPP